ncbi:hypothetical protein IFM89_020367 [Coptis chinensis]|uniref:AB hydrolase-1 domain-containing protein n=1 Tax=Coptis chinensis TaxID=261450 RepID=A0A835LS82_9MAGN|nr:hypothetical protein IFM89_020367 [Coptis chinensis]
MGNRFFCMSKKDGRDIIVGSKSKRHGSVGRNSQRKMSTEEEYLHRQALSMAIHQHQLSQRFDGSMSRRVGSTSSRRRSLPDSVTTNNNGVKQDPEFLENLQTKKFVIVHGEGFGAWCWYKTVALLEEAGLIPTAINLLGSGIDRTDTDSISTLADYAKPLIDYLQNLPEEEKVIVISAVLPQVILVGHSCGGASISYALECCPKKISKAVFVCATMVSDGQKPFDVFAEEIGSAEMFVQESQLVVYGNGKDKPPTSLRFDKQQTKGLYFNQTPSKTLDDHALSPDVQEKLVRDNPPLGVFKIKGSDHCPFFSKPQSLHKTLSKSRQIP